jgi:hypothetical protein
MAKVEVQPFKKSINESSFSSEQVAMIWDFYVTKSIAASASQKRTPRDYGLKILPWKEMCAVANLIADNIKILPANSMNKTLEKLDLCTEIGKGTAKHNNPIDIETPRIACLSPFSVADEELPKAKVGEAESVLTHIRNAFAHGNTYYFDNHFVLFEDRDSHGQITARIILSQQTLIDWISEIDKDQRYYVIVPTTDTI